MLKNKDQMITSIDTKKAFHKIDSFMRKTLSNLGIEKTFLSTITALYEKLIESH